MRSLEEIRAVMAENRENGQRDTLGLLPAEIGLESRAVMFGDDGEGYPGDAEWSAWVD
jgi:hypothetical protein